MNAMTEAEARSKSCYQRYPGTCIASQCMGWQWDAGEMEVRHTYPKEQDGKLIVVPPFGDGWTRANPDEEPRSRWAIVWLRPWGDRRQGFCGPCAAKISEVEVSQS